MRGISDLVVEGRLWRGLAYTQATLGRVREARASYARALLMAQKSGVRGDMARVSWNYGEFLVEQGELDNGLALLDACVAYEQQIGHAQAAEHAALVEQLRLGA